MNNSCECRKKYRTHLHRKVKCFVRQMNSSSRHSMVIPESFVNRFAWKISRTIKLEAPNGNVYDVGVTKYRKRTVLRSGWEAFVDANHIVDDDSVTFRYRGSSCFQVVVFDSTGCEKVLCCSGIENATSVQETSTSSTDMSSSSCDRNTQLLASGRSDGCQSGSSGSSRKRAKTDVLSSPSNDLSGKDSPYEQDSFELDDHTVSKPLYVLSGQCYVTEEQEAKIVELAEEIQPEMPLLVAMMKKPSVKPYPDLVISKDYAFAYFPHKNQTITFKLPGQSKRWHCKFRVRSNGGQCNLYGCEFVRENNLLEGDLCLFQPIMNGEGTTFTVMVHLLRKESIEHPSDASLVLGSNHGWVSTKTASKMHVKEEPTDGEESSSSEHEKHGTSKVPLEHDHSERGLEPPYMMPQSSHLTREQEKSVLKKIEAIQSELPIYVTIINKTNINPRGCLIFATRYSAVYLWKGSRSLVLQRDGESRTWHTEMHDKRRALRIFGGWASFARDNHLRIGDLCLFELMKNEGQLKMMVHIIH